MTRPLAPRVDSSSSLAPLSCDFSERLSSTRVFQLPSEISSPSTMNRRFALALLSIVLAIALVFVILVAVESGIDWRLVSTKSGKATLYPALHRKLLVRGVEPDRIGGEKCTKADIVINQGPTAPLPNGIPTYTVEIMNACVTGCDISRIHLACGWFSSARLVNPKIFKRLHYNDCLVNDGKPLLNGGTLSFQYANTFLYPLEVSHVVCY